MAKSVLAGLDLWEVERAVSRAKRSERDGAGREWQLGTSVAVMVRELLFRDGHGELEDDWIHMSRAQWRLSEYSLTEHKLRTAREKADDEGLVEYQPCIRPGDGRQTTAYRVNVWRLAEVVAESELDRCRELLATEGRKKQRDALNKRRREMEAAKQDLSLISKLDTANQGGGVDVTKCHGSLDTLSTIHTKSSTVTSVNISKDISTTVSADDSIINKIYNYMKEQGYRLSHDEYGYNVGTVDRMIEHDAPTQRELEELPAGCVDYFVWHGNLDAAKALRRMRQQQARKERAAAEPRQKGRVTYHDEKEYIL